MKTKLNVITILGVLFLNYSCSNKGEITPKIKDINELVFVSGELRWENMYYLTAQTEGVIKKFDFEEGEEVNKKTIVALIDNEANETNEQISKELLAVSEQNYSESAPNLQQLDQSIEIAENKSKQENLQLERFERLWKNQSISKIELENAQLSAKNATASLIALKKQRTSAKLIAKQQLLTTKNQFKNATTQQNYNLIRATEKGTIIKKLKEEGDYVKKGEIIAIIADKKLNEAILYVDESSIEKINLNQLVFIKLYSNKNTIYKGRIKEISPTFDEQKQSFTCKAEFISPLKKSLNGTQLEANILVGTKKHTLLIPRIYLGYGNKVNVKGKKEPVKVKTGIISNDYVEILAGITENTTIVPFKH
jgi:multidrug efflux pump subunit AcrA (membrane-fusion protein)